MQWSNDFVRYINMQVHGIVLVDSRTLYIIHVNMWWHCDSFVLPVL